MAMTTSSARFAPPAGDVATIVLSGIGTEISDGALMNMYRTYGPVVRVKHNGTNSAHVVFAQKRHALKAVQATNGAVVQGKTLKVSLQRPFKKTSEPCRGFAAGICRKGDMCKYYHVTNDAAFAPTAPPVVVATKRLHEPRAPAVAKPREVEQQANTREGDQEAKPREGGHRANVVPPEIQAISDKICRHYARGYCSQGEACNFAHVLGLSKRDVGSLTTGKTAKICLFFESGVCSRGAACRFVHTTKTSAPLAKPSPPKAVARSSREDVREPESRPKKDDRLCAECEKPGIAAWECAQCEGSLYCDDCNLAVHRARVMAKHERRKLPSLPTLPSCIECESVTARVRCEQCESTFCASCDTSVHKFKSLRKHVRVDLSSDGKGQDLATKEAKQKHKVLTKSEKEKSDGAQPMEEPPQSKSVDPMPYVESVPLLQFSSDSDSSDDEEMDEPVTAQSRDSHVTTATTAIETESDEDFDDVKLPASAPATSSVAVGSSASRPLDSGNRKDKSVAKARARPISAMKTESLSDSDSPDDVSSELTRASGSSPEEAASPMSEDDDDAPSKSTAKVTRTRKSTLAEISSESDSDSDDNATRKPVAKRAKKSVQKNKASSELRGGSEDLASTEAVEKKTKKKKTEKKTSAPELAAKKLASVSLSKSSNSTPGPGNAPTIVRKHKAGGISDGSSHTLVKKIEAFSDSSEPGELHLNANLNGFERLLAHDCAERLGLAHESTGSGLERHIIISRQYAKRSAVDSGNRLKTKKGKHDRH
ncbi:unnamed protein product [Hyaloperonospora brassicae]|uniref:Uncharacterized protein n=1 Tax=Hyaloperonospora brassicae TaxID=162125 RepID=A0AAV0UJT4_HYABA|nr:unnamed protein product [Hyaloperonospora brassicae]